MIERSMRRGCEKIGTGSVRPRTNPVEMAFGKVPVPICFMGAAKLHHCWQMLRHLGPLWMMCRAYYSVRLRTGMIRRQLPATEWNDQPLAGLLSDRELAQPTRYFEYRQQYAPKFFFDAEDSATYRPLLEQWNAGDESALLLADDLSRGFARFFSHERVDVGMPPRWHTDPFSKQEFPSDRHWSQIADFAAGDIKLAWELSRFGFVFALVRASWRSGDDRHAELFWQLVESWRVANPPQQGVNWKCGQEVSLRVMAWCFGLYGFAGSPATTPERVTMLAQMIAVSGQRIEANLSYALNQQNNHGITEAMGLWTIGSLFPELADAARWCRLGRELLESQACKLIYEDGAFSQHSMNYHRVMLHDYVWSLRIGDVQKRPFSSELRQRIAKAGELVYQLQDESSGQVPCYGQDDGALILPLNDCGYRDYRPVVQATHFLTTGRRRFEPGPWDEDLLWLFGPTALSATTETAPRRDFDAPAGGYFTLRSRHGFAFTRAAEFRHRPAQADMLHVDIWWRGLNIAVDPGTYSYNAPAPWSNPFAHTRYHNTVIVDGLDQMEQSHRFLWLPWIRGRSLGRAISENRCVSLWQGTHDGYERLHDPVTHRRALLRLGDDHWLVIDSLSGREPHAFRLHWLLADLPYETDGSANAVALEVLSDPYRVALAASAPDARFGIKRADPDGPAGWRSGYYHHREPTIAMTLETTAPCIIFASLFGPDSLQLVLDGDHVQIMGLTWAATVRIQPFADQSSSLIKHIETTGSLSDLLQMP
jgi:hypothetical protein